MNRIGTFRLPLLAVSLVLAMVGTCTAGDYVTGQTYKITTPYANPVPLGQEDKENPFCSPGPACFFTTMDVIAGSTTTNEIDVWTSTTIGQAIIAAPNGWTTHVAAYVDIYSGNPPTWSQVSDSQVGDGNPTARAPVIGVISYLSPLANNYYGLAAFHCVLDPNLTEQCFDWWFPTYNINRTDTNPWFYNGPPQVNQPSQTPSGDPGQSVTFMITGINLVNPFAGSGAAGVVADSCNSSDLGPITATNVTTASNGLQTVTLTATIPTDATPGDTCFSFKGFNGNSATVPFDVKSPNPAATPTFSPQPKTYVGSQMVTINDATSGATIYYTTDGAAPTTSSTQYTSPIPVKKTTTVKAIATAPNFDPSGVGSATYTIQVEPPTFSPTAGTYTGSQKIAINDKTSGATIYYTTNGTMPTTSSAKYSAPIPITKTTTLEAIATATGLKQSAVASGVYIIRVAIPTFSPAPGTYTGAQKVTLKDATSGATIYYTTNGTMPTTSSTKYSAPIAISKTTTLKAIATATGLVESDVASGVYTIK